MDARTTTSALKYREFHNAAAADYVVDPPGSERGTPRLDCAQRVPSLSERRLLDVAMAAAYLDDLGEDTVRELDARVVFSYRLQIPTSGEANTIASTRKYQGI